MIIILLLNLFALGGAWSPACYPGTGNMRSFSYVTTLAQTRARGPPAI
jgi:hypothetical protein